MSDNDKRVANPDKAEAIVMDGTFAQELLQEAYPVRAGRNAKAAIGEAFEALKRRERSLPSSIIQERERQWTERRVRSLWERTARRVDHYEIQDLTAVAVEEARLERQRLRVREARLEAIIASADKSRHQQIYQQSSRGIRGLDLPRGGGTDADEHTDQSRGWGR